jgi:hypothetical protein
VQHNSSASEHSLRVCIASESFGVQDGIQQLLAEPSISSGRTDAAGNSLAVLTILERSYSHLPSENHRYAALAPRPRQLCRRLCAAWAAFYQPDLCIGQNCMACHCHLMHCCYSLCRHLFLDAVLLMRDHPREHLLLVWAGILQQQGDDGMQHPPLPAHWQHRAEALWSACAGATLLSCRIREGDGEHGYSR